MNLEKNKLRLWSSLCMMFALLPTVACHAQTKIDFGRDVQPILSDNCFACHGPDKANRKSGLRLDERAAALAPAKSGNAAIVPGDVTKSTLIERIFADDAEDIMPPPKSHKKLTAAQKETLKRWVAEGAKHEQHWAFIPPAKVEPPAVKQADWPRNPVDRFVLAKLEASNLSPSPQAGKEALIRRVTLDLTGLPPSLKEVDAFLADASPVAYEKVVDRLLASPRYGERMAVNWLDAARYADTNGYQVDRDREIWRWRDWVIAAFNDNLPFDRFTIEQLAGDLLANPTQEQLIATGFHRNNMMNEEGGVDPDEFLAEYTADRVETTMTIWQAQTFNCNRCHDHKFDPFSQRDFYAMKAFFHNVPELGRGDYGKSIRENSPPHLKVSSPQSEAQIKSFREQLTKKEKQLAALPAAHADRGNLDKEIAALKKQIKDAESNIPTTLVMAEMDKPRPTFILMRGAFDAPGERVESGTPKSLPAMAAGLPRNRLGLARWLVAPENPLTARVTVNRFWQQVFGTGIVKTSDNFGAQGEYPSHPELLDWLARDFVSGGWNVKRLMKMLVTSATYRQAAAFTPRLLELDPENRLLARSSRSRLMGEFIRDQALAVGGLLVEKVGGPSVKPYHPLGIYEQLTEGSGTTTYQRGAGDDLYRRTLYTYWKRSVPHPAMLTFGTPFREVCAVQRTSSNTPLQALILLNDETYVEAARFLAVRIMESSKDDGARLTFAFRTVLARAPREREQAILQKAHQRALADFRKDSAAAKALLAVGAKPAPADLDPAELAAWATVAGTLLSMDESYTRP